MKRRYRLLFTISEFMYSSQVRNLCDLVSGLDKDIFDIEIGAMAIGDEAAKEIDSLGIPYFQLRLMPARNFSQKNLQFFKGPYIFNKKKYDIVHSLLYQSLFTEPFLIKLLSKAIFIYTKSNLEWNNHKLNWYLRSSLADRIISISHATDELLKEKGFERKIEKIYLGIDTEIFKESKSKRQHFRNRYKISDNAMVYGCAAHFIELKDHITLIEAFEQLSHRYDEIYLLICGHHHDDSYYKQVIEKIDKSQFQKRILYIGTITDMPSFYSALDCFVLPSRYESFGYVYLEAMSCSKPVISCKSGGPEEIILENQNGYFAQMSSPEDLSRKMEIYLKSKELITRHGKSGRNRVIERFSKEAMVEKCQKLYLNLLKGR